jgi:hypothetical protein
MAIGGKAVGSDVVLSTLVSDPNAANQLSSVLSITDAQSMSGLYGMIVQAVAKLQNTGGTYDIARSAPGTTGIPSVSTEGVRQTYSAGTLGFTPVATPTDFLAIVGSGTKTVRVLRISISGFATSAITEDIVLIKRSSANSGSTPVDLTAVPHDANDSAATAVIRTYTASNPTTGTAVGNVRAQKLNLGATGAAGSIVWDFTRNNDQAIVLRGTTQYLVLNWNGAAVPSGTTLDFDVEWSEE